MRKINKKFMTLVSIVAITLLMAGSIASAAIGSQTSSSTIVSGGCSLCASGSSSPDGPIGGCTNCGEAVNFAINYMLTNVRSRLPQGWYLLKSVDAAIIIVGLLGEGLQKSGYNVPQFDIVALKAFVKAKIEQYVGQQIFTVTKLLAAIIVVAGATTVYMLIAICGGSSAQGSTAVLQSALQSTTMQTSTVQSTQQSTQSTMIGTSAKSTLGV